MKSSSPLSLRAIRVRVAQAFGVSYQGIRCYQMRSATNGRRMRHRDGSDLQRRLVNNCLQRATPSAIHTRLWFVLPSTLDNIAERGCLSLERAVRIGLHLVDIRLIRDVSSSHCRVLFESCSVNTGCVWYGSPIEKSLADARLYSSRLRQIASPYGSTCKRGGNASL